MMFGTTAHTAWISMQVLKSMLPGKLISHLVGITWPTHTSILEYQTNSSGAKSKSKYMNETCPAKLVN